MRNRPAPKRIHLPDPKFHSVTITRFVNKMTLDGKKSLAYAIFYDAVDIIEKKTGNNGLEVFEAALNNAMPAVEVRPRRVGGATFQIPAEVRPARRMHLGMKWLINYARARGEKTMKERLANELIAASKGEGAAVKKRDDIHRMADSNKAFSHFRF
jgi:small subunit ribosomal protein S7